MAKTRNNGLNGFELLRDFEIKCLKCNSIISKGVISVSSRFCECEGKYFYKQITEILKQAEREYPIKNDWASHNGIIDFNEDNRRAFIKGSLYILAKTKKP